MSRRLVIHAMVALVSLVAAYVVWRQSDSRAVSLDDNPIVLDIRPNELLQLSLVDPRARIVLERRTKEGLKYVWVTVSRPDRPSISFRGSPYAVQMLEHFAPLRAVRLLGELSKAQLEEGGLEGSTISLLVATTRGNRELVIGGETAAGEGRRVLERGRPQVFILGNNLIPQPERAMSLFDGSLHDFRGEEIDRMIIESDTRKGEAVLVVNADPARYWKWKSESDRQDPELSSWSVRLLGLTARAPFLDPIEGSPALTLTYFQHERERGYLKLWNCSAQQKNRVCVALTEHTIGMVDLGPAGERILMDGRRLLGSPGASDSLKNPQTQTEKQVKR